MLCVFNVYVFLGFDEGLSEVSFTRCSSEGEIFSGQRRRLFSDAPRCSLVFFRFILVATFCCIVFYLVFYIFLLSFIVFQNTLRYAHFFRKKITKCNTHIQPCNKAYSHSTWLPITRRKLKLYEQYLLAAVHLHMCFCLCNKPCDRQV